MAAKIKAPIAGLILLSTFRCLATNAVAAGKERLKAIAKPPANKPTRAKYLSSKGCTSLSMGGTGMTKCTSSSNANSFATTAAAAIGIN